MSVIERWTIKVCRECGSNVHTDECRYTGALTDAPGDEIEVVPADHLAGAVEALDTLREPLLTWRRLDSSTTRAKLIAAIDATIGGQ